MTTYWKDYCGECGGSRITRTERQFDHVVLYKKCNHNRSQPFFNKIYYDAEAVRGAILVFEERPA